MIKKLILIILLILSFNSFSQTNEVKEELKRNYDTVLSESEGFIGVVKNGLLGFVDINGLIHIYPSYEYKKELLDLHHLIYFQPYTFKDGSAIVWEDGDYRLINKLNQRIFGDTVKIKGKASNAVILFKNNKYAIYNASGVKKTDFEYDIIKDILVSNLLIYKKDNKFGLLNNEGLVIYNHIFDTLFIYRNHNNKTFIKGKIGNKTAILDTQGKVVFQPYYQDAFVLDEEFVLSKEDNKYGIATTYGKGILYTEFDTVKMIILYDTLFHGIIGDKNMIFNSNSQLTKYFDKDTIINYIIDLNQANPFSWIIEPKASVVRQLGYDTYFAKVDSKPIILNSNSKLLESKSILNILPSTVNNIDLERLIFYGENKLLGMANYNGDTIIEPSFEDLKIVVNGSLYAYKIKGKWGLINSNAESLTYPQYKAITSSFYNGKYYIKAINFDNKTALYNEKGELLFHAYYFDIEPVKYEGFFYVTENGGKGIVDSRGNIVIKPEFDEVIVYDDTIFVARRNNEFQVFNNLKNLIYKGSSSIIDVYNSSLVAIENNKIIRIKIKNKVLEKSIEIIGNNNFTTFSQGLDTLILAQYNNKWLFVNRETYKTINTKSFTYASPFYKGFSIVIENKRLFVINNTFEEVFFVMKSNDESELLNNAKLLYNSFSNGKDHHIIKLNQQFGIIRLKIIK